MDETDDAGAGSGMEHPPHRSAGNSIEYPTGDRTHPPWYRKVPVARQEVGLWSSTAGV